MKLDANDADASYMNDEEFNTWKESLIYKPPANGEAKALNATLTVKFSNSIFISKQKCDEWKIPYKEEELENTFMGKCLRIKRD